MNALGSLARSADTRERLGQRRTRTFSPTHKFRSGSGRFEGPRRSPRLSSFTDSVRLGNGTGLGMRTLGKIRFSAGLTAVFCGGLVAAGCDVFGAASVHTVINAAHHAARGED